MPTIPRGPHSCGGPRCRSPPLNPSPAIYRRSYRAGAGAAPPDGFGAAPPPGAGAASPSGFLPPPGEELQVDFRSASADYFQTMKIPLVQGRFFSTHDTPDSAAFFTRYKQVLRERFQQIDIWIISYEIRIT